MFACHNKLWQNWLTHVVLKCTTDPKVIYRGWCWTPCARCFQTPHPKEYHDVHLTNINGAFFSGSSGTGKIPTKTWEYVGPTQDCLAPGAVCPVLPLTGWCARHCSSNTLANFASPLQSKQVWRSHLLLLSYFNNNVLITVMNLFLFWLCNQSLSQCKSQHSLQSD